MGNKGSILSLLVVLLFTSSCGTVMPGMTSVKKQSYSEDLSAYRPEIIVANEALVDSLELEQETLANLSSLQITEQLNTVLDSAASYARSTIKYIDGFTIQIYAGDNRTLANEYRINLLRKFPQSKPRMEFEQPNYKVRIGLYYTRLEAQHFFTQINAFFPKAIVIPTRIYTD